MPKSLTATLMAEVMSQPGMLQDYSLAPAPKASKGSIFTGAGDSYAAALAGFYGSKGRCMAMDPYALGSYPEVARGKEVFFISVSGRTSSNLVAAGAVAGVARRTVAITADRSSPLAEECDDVLSIPIRYVPRKPGLLSFSLTLLAVLKTVGMDGRCDFKSALAAARRGHGVLPGAGTTYFLGSSLAYPVALYAAAKTYELLGTKAHAEVLEEFSHMELFALERSDFVNLFSAFDPSGVSLRLGAALSRRGFPSHVVPSRGATDSERLFHAVFVSQLSALEESARRRLSKPAFLSDRDRLEASDYMIY